MLLFLGGAIAVIPNYAFASIVFFRRKREQDAGKAVNTFYLAEAIKLMLTALMFAAAFIAVQVEGPLLFVGYIGALLMHWLAPLLFQPKQLG